MDQLPALGTAISITAPATMPIYAPLLIANSPAISASIAARTTFSYGPHPRQTLDVYTPSSPSPSSSSSFRPDSPILVFVHGGGFVRGAKTIPGYAAGLAHANVGHFFADKLGYTTVIPDYRLMSHGARFPSGGEDVASVVEWVVQNLGVSRSGSRDLFLMGNSAGGVHLATFLFEKSFEKVRRRVLGNAAPGEIRLKGAILLSVPFHFRDAEPSRDEVLRAYFGDDVEGRCPLGLLTAVSEQETLLEGLKVLVLNGTLDPEDEILGPKRDFLKMWKGLKSDELKKALTVDMMQSQNHISPPLSLGTGIEREEAWGYAVGVWIESNRS